jgi:hypothetical protein
MITVLLNKVYLLETNNTWGTIIRPALVLIGIFILFRLIDIGWKRKKDNQNK